VLPTIKPVIRSNKCCGCHKHSKPRTDDHSQTSQSSDPFESIEQIIGLFTTVINGAPAVPPNPSFPSLASATTICTFRGWFNAIIQSFQEANLPSNINGFINAFSLMMSAPSSSTFALDLSIYEVCPAGSELIAMLPGADLPLAQQLEEFALQRGI
jgi:hypothetical protein